MLSSCWKGSKSYSPAVSDQEDSSSDSEDSDGYKNEIEGIAFTPVPEGLFSSPVPTSRSGGTAAFFRTKYIGPPGASCERWGRSPDYWLAKDVERAMDELGFYEQLEGLGDDYHLLKRWAMEYGGVLTARCESHGDADEGPVVLDNAPRKLLLLRNLRDGMKSLRMLDIKIGSKTAVAGWQGKARAAATRQALVDLCTNSAREGFRLEGFDNAGEALQTMLQGEPGGCPCLRVGQKKKRFILQGLPAETFLRHWIDFAGLQRDDETDSCLSPIEYSEALLFDAIGQLAALCQDTLSMPAPQMWIGSSVALACESGALPSRSRALETLQRRVAAPGGPDGGLARVAVFDWGRSELNTVENHERLSQGDKEMRETFWRLWKRGPLRLLFDAMYVYTSQFGSRYDRDAKEQQMVLIKVMDEDTYDQSDFVGEASLPLAPTNGPVTLPVSLCMMSNMADMRAHKSEVTLSIERGTPPPGSRLSEMWHVTVHCVNDLPKMDWMSETDPQVVVLIGPTMRGAYRKNMTPIVYNDNSARFDCRLDYGVARPDVLDSMFQMVGGAFKQQVDLSCLPMFFPKATANARWRGPSFEDFECFLDRLTNFTSMGVVKWRRMWGKTARTFDREGSVASASSSESSAAGC